MKVTVATILFSLIAVTYAVVPQCPKDGTGNERIPDSENCGKFYYCKDYVPHPAYCPPKQFFDVITLTCQDASIAVCAGNATPAPPEIPEEPSVYCPPQQGPNDNVLIQNPKDCTTFFQCVWDEPVLLHCPKGLHFNNRLKRCDYPSIAHCAIIKNLNLVM